MEKYHQIEQQLSDAFQSVSPVSQNSSKQPEASDPADASAYEAMSANDLLEIALNKADDEIYDLQGQLRTLREQHRRMEERLEKRITQQETLKRKILEKIAAAHQN